MGRKKKLPLLEDLEITDVAAEGKSIARVDNMVVFVPGLVPGDIADVQIARKRKKYMEGFVVRLKKESEIRITPFCKHFGTCGGCKWQQLPYEKQLHYKEKQVADNLQRIGKTELSDIRPILGSSIQQRYRNKLEFTFSASRWLTQEEIASENEIEDRRALGFHIPGKFDRVMNIDTCYLQDERSDRIRNFIKEYTLENGYTYYHQRENKGLMRNLIIRNTGTDEWMVVMVFGENDTTRIVPLMNHIQDRFSFITSLNYVINPKLNDTIHDLEIITYHGKDHILEVMDGLKFRIGPKSFFQTNSLQALLLYRTVLDFAELSGPETVYDLYTGTGTIAAFLARKAGKVIGIEYVEEAVADARTNIALNGLTNASFRAGDLREVLSEQFMAEYGRPDVIVTDPPRTGMHAEVVKNLLRAAPEKIVYVSCNPATQARDIHLLSAAYRITAIQPVDMFPHTHHVENVVRLDRR